MKRKLFSSILLALMLIMYSFTGCTNNASSPNTTDPIKLQMGDISYDDTTKIVSWEPVGHATSYILKVNGTEKPSHLIVIRGNIEYVMNESEGANYAVSVTAKGDGIDYTDSDPKVKDIKYSKKLSAPANIKVNNLILTWDTVGGASSYVVKIDGTDYPVTSNKYEFASWIEHMGYTVQVKVIGDGNKTESSEWSDAVDVLPESEVDPSEWPGDSGLVNPTDDVLNYLIEETRDLLVEKLNSDSVRLSLSTEGYTNPGFLEITEIGKDRDEDFFIEFKYRYSNHEHMRAYGRHRLVFSRNVGYAIIQEACLSLLDEFSENPSIEKADEFIAKLKELFEQDAFIVGNNDSTFGKASNIKLNVEGQYFEQKLARDLFAKIVEQQKLTLVTGDDEYYITKTAFTQSAFEQADILNRLDTVQVENILMSINEYPSDWLSTSTNPFISFQINTKYEIYNIKIEIPDVLPAMREMLTTDLRIEDEERRRHIFEYIRRLNPEKYTIDYASVEFKQGFVMADSIIDRNNIQSIVQELLGN